MTTLAPPSGPETTTTAPPCVGCGQVQTRQLLNVRGGRYVTCTACGVVRNDPLPPEEDLEALAEYWSENHYLQEDKLRRKFDPQVQAMAYSRVLRELEPYRCSGRLLEIGCAAGSFLDAAARDDWLPTGIELSKATATYAREQRGLDVRAGTISTVDLGGEQFDAVVMIDVIEHVYDPARLLREVHRVLGPGGALLVMTPNVRSLGARVLRSDWEAYAPGDHLWLFDCATLPKLCEQAGYTIRKRWTIDCNPFALARSFRQRLLPGKRQVHGAKPTTQENLCASIQQRNRLIGKMKSSCCLQLARALVNSVLTQLNLGDKLYLLVERD